MRIACKCGRRQGVCAQSSAPRCSAEQYDTWLPFHFGASRFQEATRILLYPVPGNPGQGPIRQPPR